MCQQVIPKKKYKTESFYAYGDLNVYRDGTVQNVTRKGQRGERYPGSRTGVYRQVRANGKIYYMHRLVAYGFCRRNCRKWDVVDHLDGKSNDWLNLRFGNHKMNMINNTTLGVYFCEGCWHAGCCGKHLGRFRNSHAAIMKVRRAKRSEYAREFKRGTGRPPDDPRMSFEFGPFYISPSLQLEQANGLKESPERTKVGPFTRLPN